MGQERRRARVEPLRASSNGKRFFSESYKRSVVEECLRPGASVSGVALAHGFNANLVRNWIGKHQRRGALVPVTVIEAPSGAGRPRREVAQAVSAEGCIEIEVGVARVWVLGPRRVLPVVQEFLNASKPGGWLHAPRACRLPQSCRALRPACHRERAVVRVHPCPAVLARPAFRGDLLAASPRSRRAHRAAQSRRALRGHRGKLQEVRGRAVQTPREPGCAAVRA